MKLSKAQQAVIDKMREGSPLMRVFPFNISKEARFELSGTRVNIKTIKPLIDKEIVKYSHKTHRGLTIHYYQLTEKWKQ